jgi:hypothetical protein
MSLRLSTFINILRFVDLILNLSLLDLLVGCGVEMYHSPRPDPRVSDDISRRIPETNRRN